MGNYTVASGVRGTRDIDVPVASSVFPCRIAEYLRFWASDESLLYDFTDPLFLCCVILIISRMSAPACDTNVTVDTLTLWFVYI